MIEKVQKFLKTLKIDGWLLYDFQKNNPLARTVLKMNPTLMTTRRFFYWIPVEGAPIKLVHAIEAQALDELPGEKRVYSSWQSLEEQLQKILQHAKKIAMEYSPKNAIPYVSLVDGGTIELVRSFGAEVVSSADFLLYFTAILTEEQIQSGLRAGKELDRIVSSIWKWIGERIGKVNEYDVQQKIVEHFKKLDWIYEHDPIVAVNAHSADPHFEPHKTNSSIIRRGDFILIDLWGKEKGGIFADITRIAVADSAPTHKQQEIFQIVRRAQKTAVDLIKNRFAQKKRLEGWEVDEAARQLIRESGYGKYFTHRTGHSIETNLHGSGAHMDDLEMHDTRPILPGSCFSIEPGIYLPKEFGVRLEFDIIVHLDGRIEINGGEQDEIVCILKRIIKSD